MATYQLQLAHLYGNLLNTYGDLGNIMALKYYGSLLSVWKTILRPLITT